LVSANLNFVAFAPDALFPLGGYPGDEDKAREAFQKLDQAKTREDFIAAADWLKSRPETSGKLGAVGFCYGGGMVNFLATRVPDLAAGVAFYGSAPTLEDVPKIKAAMLIQSAEVDERINATCLTREPIARRAGLKVRTTTFGEMVCVKLTGAHSSGAFSWRSTNERSAT